MNSTNKELKVGFSISKSLLISGEIMDKFKDLSNDFNPLHTSKEFAVAKGFQDKVAYGNLLGTMISSLVGMDLGTPDVMLISQSIKYRKPIYVGDTVTLNATISSFSEAVGVAEIDLKFSSSSNENVATGKCQVKIL